MQAGAKGAIGRFVPVVVWIVLLAAAGGACAGKTPAEVHQEWLSHAQMFVGRSKSDVRAEIGEPWAVTARGDSELWAYFGTYGPRKTLRTRVTYLAFTGDKLVAFEEGWADSPH